MQQRRTEVRLWAENCVAFYPEVPDPALRASPRGQTGVAVCGGAWGAEGGSNPRPTPCKGAALPTELSTRTRNGFRQRRARAGRGRPQLSASFKALAGAKLGNLRGLDLDRRAGARVAATAGGTFRDAEGFRTRPRTRCCSSSASISHRRSALRGARPAAGLRNVSLLCDVLDQFGFVHEMAPSVCLCASVCRGCPALAGSAPSRIHYIRAPADQCQARERDSMRRTTGENIRVNREKQCLTRAHFADATVCAS